MASIHRLYIVPVCLAFVLFAAPCVPAAPVAWQTLEPGLDMARIVLVLPSSADAYDEEDRAPELRPIAAAVTLLRIAPERFTFSLYMASEKGVRLPLAKAAEAEGFLAAINAGMFLPDRLTNTGYMKNASHVNNGRVAASFGAFFVAEPLRRRLPAARLLDRVKDDWKTGVARYAIVMQNYRMNAVGGEVLWKRRERLHSISALSQDARGKIYFIFCPDMVQGADFASELLKLPLQLRTIMYLEGGSEAALCVRAGGVDSVQTGPRFWSGSAGPVLPNILGIRRKIKAQ